MQWRSSHAPTSAVTTDGTEPNTRATCNSFSSGASSDSPSPNTAAKRPRMPPGRISCRLSNDAQDLCTCCGGGEDDDMMAPRDAMVCDGGRLKGPTQLIGHRVEEYSYIDIKRMIKGRKSSTTRKDSVDRAFGTHPSVIPGRKISVT
jgi:hypothetical protein